MKNTLRHIIMAVLLVLAQGALDNYVNLTVFLDLSLCLYIILMLPFRWGTVPAMLTGFVIGLTVDILGNGIPGMSAAAMTAAGLCRKGILSLTGPRDKEKRQSIENFGIRGFVLYSVPVILIYLGVYILLDSSGFRQPGASLARLAISLAANTALMAFLYAISTDSTRRN